MKVIKMQSDWMTEKEAAAYLRRSPRTLSRLRTKGGGPVYRKDDPTKQNSPVFYRRRELDRWTDERMATSTAFVSQHLRTN
jgi:hypothetical protein